jgi:hypothetical protein
VGFGWEALFKDYANGRTHWLCLVNHFSPLNPSQKCGMMIPFLFPVHLWHFLEKGIASFVVRKSHGETYTDGRLGHDNMDHRS